MIYAAGNAASVLGGSGQLIVVCGAGVDTLRPGIGSAHLNVIVPLRYPSCEARPASVHLTEKGYPPGDIGGRVPDRSILLQSQHIKPNAPFPVIRH